MVIDYARRAHVFVQRLGQRVFDVTMTDQHEQEKTLRSKGKDDQGPGFGGSPGRGLINGDQNQYAPVKTPVTQPTDTPELVRQVTSQTLTAWLRRRRGEVIPNTLKDLNGEAAQPPLELTEPLLQQEYSRPDVNVNEDTDVITD